MTAALTMVACSGKKAETTAAAESKMETEAAKESMKADEKKDEKPALDMAPCALSWSKSCYRMRFHSVLYI